MFVGVLRDTSSAVRVCSYSTLHAPKQHVFYVRFFEWTRRNEAMRELDAASSQYDVNTYTYLSLYKSRRKSIRLLSSQTRPAV